MADAALQRTVNRGVALVLLPLCGLVLGFERFVWSDVYGVSPPTAFGTFAYAVLPLLLFLGAFGYLIVSFGRDLQARFAAEAAG